MDLISFVNAMRLGLYQCGQVARAMKGKVAREDKEPDSIHQISTSISVVDRLCQEILLLRAYEIAPYLEIHSEELEDCPPAILDLFATNHHRYALILDPVDGTGDYLNQKETYAHMLGLLDQETGRMECGLIYFPETFRLYMAIRGQGAFVAQGFWSTPRPMTISSPRKTVENVKRLQPEDFDAFERLGFEVVPPESASAAYELTRVAEGRLGAMVMRHFHGYDTAISSVIIEALGGVALVAGGQPVTYEKNMPRMPLVISSLVPEYAEQLCQAL